MAHRWRGTKQDRRGDYPNSGIIRHASNTRSAETARFVLHVFQKKSKSGIETPKRDMDLIRDRLKVAARRVKELKDEQA
jgi:phage-related protein